MRPFKSWVWTMWVSILGAALLAGCASGSKNKWLNFFFDGVPGARKEVAAQGGDSKKVGKIELAPIWRDPPRMEAGSEDRPMSIHQPYAERRCVECHASNFSQQLKGDVSALCVACHKGFLVKARYVHAPVLDGQCTLCHQPHQAKEKFLLVKNVRDLCFDCHEPASVFLNKNCSAASDRECTYCHDPHLEDRRFLLYPPGKNSPVYKMTPDK